MCNFGGANGYDVETSVSTDGTLLGPAPNYPSSGLGLRRPTGAMTGLWAPVNDTVTKTTDVYLVAHDWTDDTVAAWWFAATSDNVGAGKWQHGTGTLAPRAVGSASSAEVEIVFNTPGVGQLYGLLNAASDRITGAGGLAGWTKRSCLWLSGPNTTCAQRLPVNNLNTYRNDLYKGAACEGTTRVKTNCSFVRCGRAGRAWPIELGRRARRFRVGFARSTDVPTDLWLRSRVSRYSLRHGVAT